MSKYTHTQIQIQIIPLRLASISTGSESTNATDQHESQSVNQSISTYLYESGWEDPPE